MIRAVRPSRNAVHFSVAAGLLWTFLAVAAAALPSKTSQGLCADARAILQAASTDRAGPSDVLSHDPPWYPVQPAKPVPGIRRMTPFGPDSFYWTTGWEGRSPSRGLVQRWYKLPYGSISRCFQSNSTELPLVKIFGDNVLQLTPVDGSTPSIISVSYPAFDRSRTHAILLFSRYFRQGFGGRTELVSLARTKYGWRKTGSRALGQS
jgi:hypothetical protein